MTHCPICGGHDDILVTTGGMHFDQDGAWDDIEEHEVCPKCADEMVEDEPVVEVCHDNA